MTFRAQDQRDGPRRPAHPKPDRLRGAPAVPAMGFWLSLGVESAEAEYARLQAGGAMLDAAPEDKPWGERCFVVRDPNGFGVNLSQSIPPSEEFMRAHATS